MHLDSEIYQQIDLYLEGKLSGMELIDFENELLTNIALKQKLEAVKLTNELILDFKLDELKSRMSEEMKNIPFENPTKSNNNWKYFTIIGILTLAGLGYYFYNQNVKSDTIVVKVESKENLNDVNENKNFNSLPENKVENSIIENKNSRITVERKIEDLGVATQSIDNKIVENKIQDNSILNNNVISTQNSKEEIQTKNNRVDIQLNCDYKITYKIDHQATCKDKSTGVLNITSIVNGKAPYLISIDNGKTFEKNHVFENLSANNYLVQIKDNIGCLSEIQVQEITSKDCEIAKKEFAFSPSLNETFKFPIEPNDEGKIQILTRNGKLVFTANISEIQEWNGESNTGFGIEAGVYVFIIEFKNGKLQKGYITLY